MSEDLDLSAWEDEDLHLKLQITINDAESIVFWEGSSTDWMFDGPAILSTLAMAMKLAQDKMIKGDTTEYDE